MQQQALKCRRRKLILLLCCAALGAGVERFWQLVGTTVQRSCGCGLCAPSAQGLDASLCADSRCNLRLQLKFGSDPACLVPEMFAS